MKSSIKLMIVDSQGNRSLDTLRRLLPGVTIRGVDNPGHKGSAYHPHGHWCAYLAGVPLAAMVQKFPAAKIEIVCVQIFDTDAKAYTNDAWLFDTIAAEQPDYISRSWGAWDQDDQFASYLVHNYYRNEWVPRYLGIIDAIGAVDFAASGNNDENDSDPDTAYPQSLMPDSCIIGARSRNGRPAKWSGDGPNILCMMWADKVLSPNHDGSWLRWSGTSAAAPKAAGCCAALGLDGDAFRDLVRNSAVRPQAAKVPHPKWGFGDMEWVWQQFAAEAPAGAIPRQGHPAGKVAAFHDFERIA